MNTLQIKKVICRNLKIDHKTVYDALGVKYHESTAVQKCASTSEDFFPPFCFVAESTLLVRTGKYITLFLGLPTLKHLDPYL